MNRQQAEKLLEGISGIEEILAVHLIKSPPADGNIYHQIKHLISGKRTTILFGDQLYALLKHHQCIDGCYVGENSNRLELGDIQGDPFDYF